MGQRFGALVLACVLCSCWGYNSSSKHWAYFGNSLLIAGGGAAIAVDQTSKDAPCTGTGCLVYSPPISGLLLAGTLVATAGLVGILLNATRAEVKTSR